MVEITVKGLAKFMTASAARQRTILRNFKYPKEDEAYAQTLYYREARDLVASYHKNGFPPEWLVDRARQLRDLAVSSVGASRTRLGHNARALEQYQATFGSRRLTLLKDVSWRLEFDGVSIKVTPDLHVRENDVEKFLKCDFAAAPTDDTVVKIVSQTMFEAARTRDGRVTASSIVYVDLPRGAWRAGARAGSRLRRDIEAACQNISAIWPRL